MQNLILRADAFALPFRDDAFAVIVADPPYEGKNRVKKGTSYQAAGYIPYRGRQWWDEAWRVLQPSGHLYVFCAVRELWDWFEFCYTRRGPRYCDIISWVAPNNASARGRRTGKRSQAWRPAIHWQKPPYAPIQWPEMPADYAMNPGQPLRTRSGRLHPFVDPNVFITPSILSTMHEAQPWPNQLPVKLLRWLLRPHVGTGPVLDLFSGTGSTRVAATGLHMPVVSIELSPKAIGINRGRPAQQPVVVTR